MYGDPKNKVNMFLGLNGEHSVLQPSLHCDASIVVEGSFTLSRRHCPIEKFNRIAPEAPLQLQSAAIIF